MRTVIELHAIGHVAGIRTKSRRAQPRVAIAHRLGQSADVIAGALQLPVLAIRFATDLRRRRWTASRPRWRTR